MKKNFSAAYFRKILRLVLAAMTLTLFATSPSTAQVPEEPARMEPFLLLEKPGTTKRFRYFVGDEITLKLKEEKDFRVTTVIGFTDTSFFITDNINIALDEVEALADRSKVKGVKKLAITSFTVVPTVFLLSAANNLFNTGRRPLIGSEVYGVSGVFAGLGALGMLYNGRRYRLHNKWRIIVVAH